MAMKSKVMIGAISYLKPDMKFHEHRVKYHKQQLEYWENFPEDIPFYQVEIFYDDKVREALTTALDVHSIAVNEPSPPGKSRNYLLKALYESDYDWLVCCDDDQVMDPMLESFDLIQNLTPELAAKGAMITFQNATWITLGKSKQVLSLRSDPRFVGSHVLEKSACDGNMQVSCIPNLVKYGREPVWFDEVTMAQEHEIPEDAKFQIDWLASGNPIYLCKTIFNVALDNYVKSSIYKSARFRYMTNKTRTAVLDAYARSRVPHRADIQSWADFGMKKNPALHSLLIPMTCERQKLLAEDKFIAAIEKQAAYRRR